MQNDPYNSQLFSEADDPPLKFDNPSVRSNFIRKVYLILCTQLVFTSASVTYVASNPNSAEFYQTNTYLLIIAVVVYLVTLYSLFCVRSLARKVPINYILLTLFTFAMSFIACCSVAFADPQLVVFAAFLTALVVIALTLYAFTTSTDFTMMGGLMFIISMLLFGIILLSFFFVSKIFEIILASLLCFFYGIFLIFDTQLIVGGRAHQLEIDDYIIGALSLYIDIVRLFIEILQILQLTNQN